MRHTPEKLSLWDRWFNRYRREVKDQGTEIWQSTRTYQGIPLGDPTDYARYWVEYRVIDRLTGSERLERTYIS